jgi:hypothetical protein
MESSSSEEEVVEPIPFVSTTVDISESIDKKEFMDISEPVAKEHESEPLDEIPVNKTEPTFTENDTLLLNEYTSNTK